ncbi:hypothetical protein Tco_1236172 [Tanacetum coccineum]
MNKLRHIPDPTNMLEDDVELIFPYEVEGDKTPPPGDVSSDSEQRTRRLMLHLEVVVFTRGNVLERVSVLESGENATLKKRLDETETKLAWACMERDITERRLHESRVWNKMFYLDMVRIGAVSKPPSDDEDTERIMSPKDNSWLLEPGGGGARCGGAGASGGGAGGAGASGAGVGGARPAAPKITGCTYVTFKKCDPQPFKGTEGAWVYVSGLRTLVYVFRISVARKGMVEAWQLKGGAVYSWVRQRIIRGDLCHPSRPTGIDEAVRMAYQLMGQIIQDKTDEVSEGEKRKGEGDRGGRGDNRRDYNRRQNQRRANAGAMTNDAPNDNEVLVTGLQE